MFPKDRENGPESPVPGAMSAKCAAMCRFEGVLAQTANWTAINVLLGQRRIKGKFVLFLPLPRYLRVTLP